MPRGSARRVDALGLGGLALQLRDRRGLVSGIKADARALMETRSLNDGDTRDLLRGNATELFPRLRANDPHQ